jgi:aconitate hydratase
MSPPLVVAFALAGRIDIDFRKDAIGNGKDGKPVYLADIWPTQREVEEAVEHSVTAEMFWRKATPKFSPETSAGAASTFPKAKPTPGKRFHLHPPRPVLRRHEAPALGRGRHSECPRIGGFGRQRDHRSHFSRRVDQERRPRRKILASTASSPPTSTPTARAAAITKSWCAALLPTSACATNWFPTSKAASPATCPDNQEMSIFEASRNIIPKAHPLIILAGKEYGSGSSRDWAAKGPRLLGVSAVIAESYERIHRSNLVGMGILPLQFEPGQTAESLNLTGEEVFEITGIRSLIEHHSAGQRVKVRAASAGTSGGGGKDKPVEFDAFVRIDTPQEALYYANGGILQYVLRQLLAGKPSAQTVGV